MRPGRWVHAQSGANVNECGLRYPNPPTPSTADPKLPAAAVSIAAGAACRRGASAPSRSPPLSSSSPSLLLASSRLSPLPVA